MAEVFPTIPETITVHLGPKDSNAQNVTVSFSDYIKNVASSEIYPTWNEEAIKANIYAQISYALNRVYTEFYRSQGYDFDITSSTATDQKFIYGRNIFENIDRIVDEIFDSYIRRIGFVEPLAAKYCNGTTVTCEGLSQWGSENLARQGFSAFEILTYYYGDNIELVTDVPIRDLEESYPGFSLRRGNGGRDVATIQVALNQISQNYPSIPKIYPVDGIFGEQTENAVKRFQRIFNLTEDGIVGKATWYKIISLYVGILRLSELNSEGQTYYGSNLKFTDTLSLGSQGEKVFILQYFLNVLSEFISFIPPVAIDGVFGESTRNAVTAFQKYAGLTPDGIAGERTWNLLYNGVRGIIRALNIDFDVKITSPAKYPGTPLSQGSSGPDVTTLQNYLNFISLSYRGISFVSPTGFYGEQTRQSVTEFQRRFGLPETGVVDEATWNLIGKTYVDLINEVNVNLTQFPGRNIVEGDTDFTHPYV